MSQESSAELQRLIEALDQCWLQGRPQEARRYFHPDVVFAGPQFQRLACGIEACIKGYEDFLAIARIHAFQATDYVADVADQAAVVTYRWTIDYQIGDKRSVESGREMLVLVRPAGTWLVRWRVQLPEAASAGPSV